jgi:hypothetical protein
MLTINSEYSFRLSFVVIRHSGVEPRREVEDEEEKTKK